MIYWHMIMLTISPWYYHGYITHDNNIVVQDIVISCLMHISMYFLWSWTPLFHVLLSMLYRYSFTLAIIISCSYITVTWIHLYACFDCSYISLHWSLFLLHGLLLHEHSCIPIIWILNIVHDCFLCFIDMILMLP